ncbi:Aspartate/glutamate/uridylate kinase [Pterulicium gracile]|uniref:aspartate kinase n=1 Tax=Pterulicium gracile TaxID=1884261 RepID=A0A5C3QS19_9AGAR|nr:Aspartate/glutamate/uridylate kinase [Pterula gracilis]
MPIETHPSVQNPTLRQNSTAPHARYLVQKFGGTSVGKFVVNIARDVVSNYLNEDNKVVVVCSARSGSTKALGTTNLLLRAASETLKRKSSVGSLSNPPTPFANSGGLFGMSASTSVLPTPHQTPPMTPLRGDDPLAISPLTPLTVPQPDQILPEFNKTVDIIRVQHLDAARAAVRNPEVLQALEAEIERDCDWLRGFLFAAQVINEISPRSKDSIVGLGERLACRIVTAALVDQGIDAEYVSLENIIPEFDGEDSAVETTLDQAFYDRLALAVGNRVKQCGPRIPVVTGFFGPTPGSLLTQIGRGYTDLLSALLAVGLSESTSELQIWKEVDGIFTADPRKVPTARLIPVISPDEAAELTYYGSEVVHPFTMEQVIRRRIPIRIKNVENPVGGGTVIRPDEDGDGEEGEEGKGKGKAPTAVTIKENIVVLNVNSNRKSVSHGFLAGIFGTLDQYGVVVDLISTSEVHVSMAIENNIKERLFDRLVVELRKSGTVSTHRQMAILSLVGKQMRNMYGTAGRMFSVLAEGNVNIEMISQGASEINISCVIREQDAVKALNLIHQRCLSFQPEPLVKVQPGPWLL